MTVIKLQGVLEWDDAPYAISWDKDEGDDTQRGDDEPYPVYRPYIGGVDVIRRIERTKFNGAVTVAVAGQTFTGESLIADMGSPTYSELTPGDPAELFVTNPQGPDNSSPWFPDSPLNKRGHNIARILHRHDGEPITLWVADEPIDVME